ncbi:glycosyltransferase [Lysinibacillus sp. B2A1]|nr:glycosyltransferase [Lysinibacillus sp. B2A1]
MKKILLLGEYSGLHTNLKSALVRLGHEVTLASAGDGKKGIYGDLNLNLESTTRIGKFKELKNILEGLEGYDIVQFINPYVSHKLGVLLYNTIYSKNDKIYCVAAGDDVEFLSFVLNGGMTPYTVFDEYIEQNHKLEYTSLLDKYLHRRFMSNMDGIIPAMWEYAESYRKSMYQNKLKETIPLSIDLEKIQYEEPKIGNKIVFYHASNRPLFKGTANIIKAMEIFKSKYPNDVEMINADFLPLNEYLEVMSKTHVVIDQCRSFSYGMNALYSGAKGKIVMSGSEEVAMKELKVENSPIINITPDISHILNEFERILENKHKILEMSHEIREYIEEVHDCSKIALRYLNTWK